MVECGRRAQPNEGCALLFGKKFQEPDPKTTIPRVAYVVELVECVPSSQLSWGSFFIDEMVLYEKTKNATTRGYQLVGIYHSHPAPAEPSSMDKKYMSLIDAYKPIYAVWIIQSTISWKETKAYFYSNKNLYKIHQEIC